MVEREGAGRLFQGRVAFLDWLGTRISALNLWNVKRGALATVARGMALSSSKGAWTHWQVGFAADLFTRNVECVA